MIDAIDIRNFRCFEHLEVGGCGRINVIVGDNGSGKTALLEAIFMGLGVSPELGIRFRQQRGLDVSLPFSPTMIEDGIFADLFYERDMGRVIAITLTGTGPEARSVRIERGRDQTLFPADQLSIGIQAPPLTFTWRDATGRERSTQPQNLPNGSFQLGGTGENLSNFYYFFANQNVSSTENAMRFSILSRSRREREFVDIFTREYPYIEDLSIEVPGGGSPAIHATVRGLAEKIPVTNLSGAINRLIGIMLAIAAQANGVLLIDELENGIYYRHHTSVWRSILDFARKFEAQIFTTTHNEEWLEALVEAGSPDLADISFWRLERRKGKFDLRQFSGSAFKAGIVSGSEVR